MNIQTVIALAIYLVAGFPILKKAIRNIGYGEVFDENFLMCVASIGALILGEYTEGIAVMVLYRLGEYLQDKAVDKSRRAISGLMDIRPDYANIEQDGQLVQVDPESLVSGSIIVIKPGERIPADGRVIDGSSSLDTAAITGESVPRDVSVGDEVYSGTINNEAVLKVEVTAPARESTAARILDLVENAASSRAKAEKFITKFARWYTPAVCGAAALLMVIPPLVLGGGWSTWVFRGLIFLVVSCPCALIISIPLGFFAGIGCCSSHGILVKGGNYLEALTKVDTIVFDKTGTLTRGVFEVSSVQPALSKSELAGTVDLNASGVTGAEDLNTSGMTGAEYLTASDPVQPVLSESELLELAALAESYSDHPISKSLAESYGKEIDRSRVTEAHETAGHGVSALVDGRQVACGNHRLMESLGIEYAENSAPGTVVYVAIDGRFAGSIVISDRVKDDAAAAIAQIKASGIRNTVMLTGDKEDIAKTVAAELDIENYFGDLLPQDKVSITKELKAGLPEKTLLAFVGDGINDAPVLASAGLGIAMGGMGSAAAVEAADIVLMNDKPSDVALAVKIAKKTMGVVYQDIIFSLFVKIGVLILTAFGYSNMWLAIFADVGVCMLAILNSMRCMRI